MGANGCTVRNCDRCGFTKHDVTHTETEVTNLCLQCGRKVVSNRAAEAKRFAKVRAGRKRYTSSSVPTREA